MTTEWCLGDIVEVVSGAGNHLDCLMIPKVENAGELHFVDHLLNRTQTQHKIGDRIGIEAQIETRGDDQPARDRDRDRPDRDDHLRPGDYAASIGVTPRRARDRLDRPGLSGRRVALTCLSKIVTTARAFGSTITAVAPHQGRRDRRRASRAARRDR